MEPLDNLLDNSGSGDPRAAENTLKAVTQDLQNLRRDLVAQLSEDIRQLQSEKSRLAQEVETLRTQQNTLLSQRQLAQQQAWAKQLAQALAQHLQAQLAQNMSQSSGAPQRSTASEWATATVIGSTDSTSENFNRLLSSLDGTLTRTISSIQQDLNSYQSALAQQINRMQTLEQQGEAILDALVERLSQQVQLQAHQAAQNGSLASDTAASVDNRVAVGEPSAFRPAQDAIAPQPGHRSFRVSPPKARPPRILPVAPANAPDPPVAPSRGARYKALSQLQVGLVLILISTVALSLHNVVVGIIGNKSSILGGVLTLGGFLQLGLGNALFILLLRMLVVVPLMLGVANTLYPPVWKDIQRFLQSRNHRLLFTVVGSGAFLFLSQVLIYMAIAEVGPGVAVTILFMYPLITVPLEWLFFKNRPSYIRWLVMFLILLGIVLTAFPSISNSSMVSGTGVILAASSGIAFACYLISMQICFRRLHPVPVSVTQFITIGFFASISLILLPSMPFPEKWGTDVAVDQPLGFLIGGLVLGILTLIGYLANNFGVRYLGAGRASIIASSGPVLTAVLAFIIIPGPRTALQSIQILGIAIVTFGLVALSFERIALQRQAAKAAKPQT